MSTHRIKQYEMKVTKKGRKLILWKPLERGGRAVAAAAELPGKATMAALMATGKISVTLPTRLTTPRV